MHPDRRPRERLLKLGGQALDDAELLALLLGSGCRGRGVLALARGVLRRFPRRVLSRRTAEDFLRVKGIGPGRAAALAAALELGRRSALDETAQAEPLDDPSRVWESLHDVRSQMREHFVAFYLDAVNRALRRETISIGTLTAGLAHPREVYGPAVELRAAAVILAHNHPSGDPRPSREDRRTTRRMARSGAVLGIRLLDHVVVAAKGFFSFRKEGLL